MKNYLFAFFTVAAVSFACVSANAMPAAPQQAPAQVQNTTVQKIGWHSHSRWRSHHRWGSRGYYHGRYRSHHRWGSRGYYHGRHRSHHRWGSRHHW